MEDVRQLTVLFLCLWAMQPVIALPPSPDLFPAPLLRLFKVWPVGSSFTHSLLKRAHEEGVSAATMRDELQLAVAESALTGPGELELWRAALTRPTPLHSFSKQPLTGGTTNLGLCATRYGQVSLAFSDRYAHCNASGTGTD